MRQLVFFLEEPSAKAMLQGLFPRLLADRSDITPRYVVFEGKQDMAKELPKKLKAWRTPGTSFVVLRDKDSGDCKRIKAELLELCRSAERPNVLVRIACHEQESWYLGDLRAVEQGLQIPGLAKRS